MGVSKRIFGGRSGYSLGKVRRARKKPPVCDVSTGVSTWEDCVWVCTSVELCVVVDHQHHLPLEHIVVHQTAAYARYTLVVLHLLELASQQPRCRRRRSHSTLLFAYVYAKWRSKSNPRYAQRDRERVGERSRRDGYNSCDAEIAHVLQRSGCSCSCVREVLCAPVLLRKEGRWRFQRRVRAQDVEGS